VGRNLGTMWHLLDIKVEISILVNRSGIHLTMASHFNNFLQGKPKSQPGDEVERILDAVWHEQPPFGNRVWVLAKFYRYNAGEWFRPEAIQCDRLIKEYYARVHNAPMDAYTREIVDRIFYE